MNVAEQILSKIFLKIVWWTFVLEEDPFAAFDKSSMMIF
jgi:hypothetical protein